MTDNETRYKEALLAILKHGSTPRDASIHAVNPEPYRIANEALNPPQEFEEVEVYLWKCLECGLIQEGQALKTCARCLGPSSKGVLKYTAIDRRPVKPKVKARYEISPGEGWAWKDPYQVGCCPQATKFYAECQE